MFGLQAERLKKIAFVQAASDLHVYMYVATGEIFVMAVDVHDMVLATNSSKLLSLDWSNSICLKSPAEIWYGEW